jgi:hypothetical protein
MMIDPQRNELADRRRHERAAQAGEADDLVVEAARGDPAGDQQQAPERQQRHDHGRGHLRGCPRRAAAAARA